MENVWVYPYDIHSEGGTALAKILEVKKIKHRNSVFKGKADRIVINWGNSYYHNPQIALCKVLNECENVHTGIDKRITFTRLSKAGVRIPEFTTDYAVAAKWLKDKVLVVCRQEVDGQDGSGIVLVSPGQNLPKAPLYTKYIPKTAEYRVHYIRTYGTFYQLRVKRTGWNDKNNNSYQIRTSRNGYGFNLVDDVPFEVKVQAVTAFTALGFDFGGADVIYNKYTGKAYILEINSAPEIFGVTLSKYKTGLTKLINSMR